MDYYEKIREIRNEKFEPVLEEGCEILCFENDFYGHGDFYPKDYLYTIGSDQLSKRFEDIKVCEHRIENQSVELICSVGSQILGFKHLAIDKVLGKPVSLQDIIRLAKDTKENTNDCAFYKEGDNINFVFEIGDIPINLSKSIKDQEEEDLKLTYELLKS